MVPDGSAYLVPFNTELHESLVREIVVLRPERSKTLFSGMKTSVTFVLFLDERYSALVSPLTP